MSLIYYIYNNKKILINAQAFNRKIDDAFYKCKADTGLSEIPDGLNG